MAFHREAKIQRIAGQRHFSSFSLSLLAVSVAIEVECYFILIENSLDSDALFSKDFPSPALFLCLFSPSLLATVGDSGREEKTRWYILLRWPLVVVVSFPFLFSSLSFVRTPTKTGVR